MGDRVLQSLSVPIWTLQPWLLIIGRLVTMRPSSSFHILFRVINEDPSISFWRCLLRCLSKRSCRLKCARHRSQVKSPPMWFWVWRWRCSCLVNLRSQPAKVQTCFFTLGTVIFRLDGIVSLSRKRTTNRTKEHFGAQWLMNIFSLCLTGLDLSAIANSLWYAHSTCLSCAGFDTAGW